MPSYSFTVVWPGQLDGERAILHTRSVMSMLLFVHLCSAQVLNLDSSSAVINMGACSLRIVDGDTGAPSIDSTCPLTVNGVAVVGSGSASSSELSDRLGHVEAHLGLVKTLPSCANATRAGLYSVAFTPLSSLYSNTRASRTTKTVWCDGGWALVYRKVCPAFTTCSDEFASAGGEVPQGDVAPTSTDKYLAKLSDEDVNAMRRRSVVANDLKLRVRYGGVVLGESYHRWACAFSSTSCTLEAAFGAPLCHARDHARHP